MSDGATGGDAGQQTQGQTQGNGEGGAPDIGQLASQLEGLTSGQEELRQHLQSLQGLPELQQGVEQLLQAQQPEPEQEPGPDLSFIDDPDLSQEELATRFQDVLNQTVESRLADALKQHIEPLRNEWREQRMQNEARDLVEEFPDLARKEVAEPLMEHARELADRLGQPELAKQPGFWRLVHMAQSAADRANQEDADAPPAARLESGAGAAPAASGPDLAQMIVRGGSDEPQGRAALPFL